MLLAGILLYSNIVMLEQVPNNGYLCVSNQDVYLAHADSFVLRYDHDVTGVMLDLLPISHAPRVIVGLHRTARHSRDFPEVEPFVTVEVPVETTRLTRAMFTSSHKLNGGEMYWVSVSPVYGSEFVWAQNKAGDRAPHAERNNNDLGWFLLWRPTGPQPVKGAFAILGAER